MYIGGIILFRSLQIFQNKQWRNYSDKRKRNLDIKTQTTKTFVICTLSLLLLGEWTVGERHGFGIQLS
jgi:hypothetical protein